MPTKFTFSGTVLDQGTEKPLSGAIIRMETPTKVLSAITDKNGVFKIPAFEEPELLEGQKVLLYAYYKEGRQQEPAPYFVTINKDQDSYDVEIKMVNRGPISNRAGKIFLAILILLLVALMGSYYFMHSPKGDEKQKGINPKLVNMLTKSLIDRITEDSMKISAFKPKKDSIVSRDQQFITAELQQIKEATNELFKVSQIDAAFQALISRNLEDVKRAIDRRNKEEIQAALLNSKAYIKEVPSFEPSWFWQTVPNIYFEILLWALFATLLRLIGNTSYYVSRNIFLRDSISHKAALLVTIPLIALLITFVISFFKIVVFIGGAKLALDFTEPYVSIILASLIGLAPWRAWEFMYGLADLLFISLKKWLGLGKPGDEKSEGSEKNTGETTNPEAPKDSINPSGAIESDEPETNSSVSNESEVPAKSNVPTDPITPTDPDQPNP